MSDTQNEEINEQNRNTNFSYGSFPFRVFHPRQRFVVCGTWLLPLVTLGVVVIVHVIGARAAHPG